MKTTKRMCLVLMLIALYLSLSAQSIRLEITGSDTCVVLPMQQLRIANAKFVELKQCREENDSLFSQIRTYTGLTNNLRASVIDLKQANTLNAAIISDKQKIIDISAQELKKESRRGKILRLERNSVAAACLILIGKILIF